MNTFLPNIYHRFVTTGAEMAARLFCGVLTLAALFLASPLAAQQFDGLSSAIEQGDFGNLKAVIVSQHGEIIYEDYFRGSQADDLHQVQSVTKSVGSALIGIAHRQGKIELDQRLEYYFSDLYDLSQTAYQGKADITVEHILQQRHGVAWDEESTDYRNPQNSARQMIESGDWYQYFLTRPMDAEPGEKFTYSSGASTLMSRLLRVSTGMATEEFAMQELFAPLEIDQVHWEVYSEDGPGTGLMQWPGPDHDVPLGFSLWLKARDMLKFGELYLNGGVYNGQRILDQSWIEASWTKYSNSENSDYFPEPGWGHGYQWWIANIDDTLGRSWDIFFASGWGSQVIFVVPELDLVVVTTADNYNYNGPDVDALLLGWILPELNPVLDDRFTGSWYDPSTNGQGFSLQILEERNKPVGYWYTYTDTGDKRWFTISGRLVDGIGQVNIRQPIGGIFLQDDLVTMDDWGTATIRPIDCNHIEFEVESAEVSTIIPLTRLTGVCFMAP
ncbi:MAG: beta-lactamase family protein [Xanthomonadales bacterium]|nr:beta-lactamase family protein [Xanthomonadales bacterium]